MTRRSPAPEDRAHIEAFGGAGPECITALVDLVRRRIREIDLRIADHESRVTHVEAELAELRDRRIDPGRDAEVVATEILELVRPRAAERLADALLIAADDVAGVVA